MYVGYLGIEETFYTHWIWNLFVQWGAIFSGTESRTPLHCSGSWRRLSSASDQYSPNCFSQWPTMSPILWLQFLAPEKPNEPGMKALALPHCCHPAYEVLMFNPQHLLKVLTRKAMWKILAWWDSGEPPPSSVVHIDLKWTIGPIQYTTASDFCLSPHHHLQQKLL